MRLLILSDLHLELWREHAPHIDPSISNPDVVVLAGDIHTDSRAVRWAAEKFVGIQVLYVAGNHEFYGRNIEKVPTEIRAECARYDNVHFLDCEEFVLGHVRFLGATFWTDFDLYGTDNRPLAQYEAGRVMTDYRRIQVASEKYRWLTPADTVNIHARHKAWLKERLAVPFDGKTVVITHTAPSMRSVATRYERDFVSAGFASNLDELVEQADVWVHGHMHDSFDYQIGKCRVVCNPCGYMTRSGGTENEHYDPNFTVQLI